MDIFSYADPNAIALTSPSTHMVQSTTPFLVIDQVEGDLLATGSLMNISVNSTVQYVPIVTAGIVFTTLCVVGALAIILFILVLIVGHKTFNEFPFFIIVWHLTITNAVHVSCVITSILPLMLLNLNDDNIGIWYTWASRIIAITEQAALYLTFLMTINRFVVFVLPNMSIYFNKTGIMIMAMIIWVYVFFIVSWNVAYGTIKVFSKKKLKALTLVDQLLGGNFLTQFFNLCFTILPVIMLGMYAIIVVVIIKKRSSAELSTNKISRRDQSFLWQAFVVTLALELCNLAAMFSFFFKDKGEIIQWSYTIFNYSTSIFNQIVNPVISLTCNRMVKRTLIKIFKRELYLKWVSETSEPAVQLPKNQASCLSRFNRMIPLMRLPSSRKTTLVTEVHSIQCER